MDDDEFAKLLAFRAFVPYVHSRLGAFVSSAFPCLKCLRA